MYNVYVHNLKFSMCAYTNVMCIHVPIVRIVCNAHLRIYCMCTLLQCMYCVLSLYRMDGLSLLDFSYSNEINITARILDQMKTPNFHGISVSVSISTPFSGYLKKGHTHVCTCTCIYTYMYMYMYLCVLGCFTITVGIHVHVHVGSCGSLIFSCI